MILFMLMKSVVRHSTTAVRTKWMNRVSMQQNWYVRPVCALRDAAATSVCIQMTERRIKNWLQTHNPCNTFGTCLREQLNFLETINNHDKQSWIYSEHLPLWVCARCRCSVCIFIYSWINWWDTEPNVNSLKYFFSILLFSKILNSFAVYVWCARNLSCN